MDQLAVLKKVSKAFDRTISRHLGSPISDTFIANIYLDFVRRGTLEIIKDIPNLKTLSLMDCRLVTDDEIKFLCMLGNLNELDLRGCHQLTDIGFVYLRSVKNLKALCGMGNIEITDVGLAHLVNVLKNLRVLDLAHCEQITDAEVVRLETLFPTLDIMR